MAETRERIGLTLPAAEDATLEERLELVQLAERLGYDSIWIGEAWGPECFTTLTWLACNTSTIKLASGIVNVFSRTPGLIAQTVATLDRISGGRVILGLGTSGRAVIENWHGVPFERGVQRLKEYAEIIHMALAGERVTYEGQIFHLRGFRINTDVPRARVPIYFASITPGGLRAVGQAADGWLPIWTSAESMGAFLKDIGAAAEGVGRSLADIDVAADLHAGVSPDPGVRDLGRRHLAHYIGNMGVYYHDLVSRQGFEAEADAIQEAFARRDREGGARLVTDQMVDRLTLVGDADKARLRLQEYRNAGVTLPLVNFVGGLTKKQVRDTLEALAPGR